MCAQGVVSGRGLCQIKHARYAVATAQWLERKIEDLWNSGEGGAPEVTAAAVGVLA